jgi:hypothetical protein
VNLTAIERQKEFLEHEKTTYYERLAFLLQKIPETAVINGIAFLNLTIGASEAITKRTFSVKKSMENLRFFIGFQMHCPGPCIST